MSAADIGRLSAQTFPARNPRRRTRQEIDGSSSQRQTRRKRSKLDGDSFTPLGANGHASPPATNGTRVNGHAIRADTDDPVPDNTSNAASTNKDYPSIDNNTQGDGVNTLTRTEVYQASQLPSTPDELHDSQEEFRGWIQASSSLALAVTRRRAYVWNYAHSASPNSIRVFDVPHLSKDSEPLPVAAIVKSGSSSDTGLVVVSPQSGRVTFWENVDNAAALSLFEQKRNGTEGSVGGMLSGELVTDIAHADPAGFVITFSSGRVAQLCLWDSQSHPSISVRFLKSAKSNTGYLGGIWNALGIGGFLRDVVAVRSQVSKSRGLADTIVASEHAVFQHWQLSWSSQPSLKVELDARDAIQKAVGDQVQHKLPSAIQSVSLIDIVITSTESTHSGTTFRLICLVGVQGALYSTYCLLEAIISQSGSIDCGEIYTLNSYAAPLATGTRWHPRICFPAKSSTILVAFEKAIVIFCRKQQAFQDTIYLRDDDDVHITGLNAEPFNEQREEAMAVVHIRGEGAVRITVHEAALSDDKVRLSARTKIEQAVFYDNKPHNPFNLGRGPELQHPIGEVEDAALLISKDIMASKYPDVLPNSNSTDNDLLRRATALDNLARHLKHAYANISRVTKWKLMWDAEKMAAARRIWSDYDQSKKSKNVAPLRLLPQLISLTKPEEKTAPEGHADELKMYFRHNILNLEKVVPWAYQVIFSLAQRAEVRESERLLQLVCDGSDILSGTLEAAFTFRQRNAWAYGLESENLQDGLLQSVNDYQGLPEFWTSTHVTVTKIKEFIDNSQVLADNKAGDELSIRLAAKIGKDSPILIAAWLQTMEERFRWSESGEDFPEREQEKADREECLESRTTLLVKLNDLGQHIPGVELAEKYQDMRALTMLFRRETVVLVERARMLQKHPRDETAADIEKRHAESLQVQNQLDEMESRVRKAFDKFGSVFYAPYFSDCIEGRLVCSMLDLHKSFRTELTQFLRGNPDYRKVSWINDVLVERDYGIAAEALVRAAPLETHSYNKSVEISFAKLALLAAEEDESTSIPVPTYQHAIAAGQEALKIQSELCELVKPIHQSALDRDAELQLLMDQLAQRNVPESTRPALRQLLERGFEMLVDNNAMEAEELADVLSLMDVQNAEPDSFDMDGREKFGWALRTLHASGNLGNKDLRRMDLAKQVTWRRAFLADDWPLFSSTERPSDEILETQLCETVLFTTFAGCLRSAIISPSKPAPLPEAVLEAGTTAESWLARFPRLDLAEPIAADNANEASQLQEYLDDHDLKAWVTTVSELAVRVHQEQSKTGKSSGLTEDIKRCELLLHKEFMNRTTMGPMGSSVLQNIDSNDDAMALDGAW